MEKLLKSFVYLFVAIAGMFYTPWVLLNAYTLIAKEFNWFVPLYWQMFALVMFKGMLHVNTATALSQIRNSVCDDNSLYSTVITKPIVLTLAWFFIWLAL